MSTVKRFVVQILYYYQQEILCLFLVFLCHFLHSLFNQPCMLVCMHVCMYVHDPKHMVCYFMTQNICFDIWCCWLCIGYIYGFCFLVHNIFFQPFYTMISACSIVKYINSNTFTVIYFKHFKLYVFLCCLCLF